MAKTATEESIRRYLKFLEDPSSLRDDSRIEKLQRELKTTTDPIAKLKILNELQSAQEVDGAEARLDFVKVAKQWADSEGIDAESFRELGVPNADLAAAGFAVRGRRPARTSRGRRRSRRVPVSEIKAAVASLPSRFTVRDLEAATGGTNATVRKALAELLDEGAVREVGPDPQWSRRGRSPMVYERT